MDGQDFQWSRDIRPGWMVTLHPADDGRFWAVHRSGVTVNAPDRLHLLGRMMAKDVARTLRESEGKAPGR